MEERVISGASLQHWVWEGPTALDQLPYPASISGLLRGPLIRDLLGLGLQTLWSLPTFQFVFVGRRTYERGLMANGMVPWTPN